MEEQAQSLLTTLRKQSCPIDAKIAQLNSIKSSIKHLRVPDAAQATIFECIRLAIASTTSVSLVATGFSTLAHFIKRLGLQNQTSVVVANVHKLWPILLERLGDPREGNRNAASQTLADLWPYCPTEVERLIREQAMAGTNSRAKEMGMQWVVKMNKSEGIQFRSYVPLLVASLEDADAGVRESAKAAVVELFRPAPERAKADLQKQLAAQSVRKTIANYIISQLSISSGADADLKASVMSSSVVTSDYTTPEPASLGDSMISEHPPPAEVITMDPLYVRAQRELDEIFRDMHIHFEGKETEQNWMLRDKTVLKLRRLNKGNAPTEFTGAFVAGIKGLLDGIVKVANSLRTTMSTNGCQLVQELCKTLGPAMDPMSEILLQNFVKMSAATKHISAQGGNVTVDLILANTSYSKRVMEHVWFAAQDKNIQPRQFSSGWLKTLIRKHSQNRSQMEHSGGVDIAEKIIKRGLADANPKVREGMRGTYWVFAQVWAQRAEAIMDTLDAKSRQNLEKDPGNPNASLASSQSSVKSTSSRTKAPVQSKLRETIAAQRREALARRHPDRPTSAQSTFSPMKQPSMPSLRATAKANVTARPPSAASGRLNSSTSSAGGNSLSTAPVRRPKRPELTRPATADPYASRRGAAQNVTPSDSPAGSPSKEKKSYMTKSTARPKSRGGYDARRNSRGSVTTSSPSLSPVRTKTRNEPISHRKIPSIDTNSPRIHTPSSSSKAEDMTMVLPFARAHSRSMDEGGRRRPVVEKTVAADSSVARTSDDDGFTMVIPAMKLAQPAETTSTGIPSPPKAKASPFGSPVRLDFASRAAASGVTSPLSLRSPKLKSPRRAVESRDDETPATEPVKVYEDPFAEDEGDVAQGKNGGKQVLEELPLNEKNPPAPRGSIASLGSEDNGSRAAGAADEPRSPRKANGSVNGESQDRSEVLRSRRLLASGIERIRSRTLDAHGFRRVQDLIKSNHDVWGPDASKFGDLLLALLEYLEAPADSLKTTPLKAHNLKIQVLATIRAMLVLHAREARQFAPKALCSILETEKMYAATEHISVDLEKTAEEILRMGGVAECLDAVLDLVERLPNSAHSSPSPPSPISPRMPEPPSDIPTHPPADNEASKTYPTRTTTAALFALTKLLNMSQVRSIPLTPSQTGRLGRAAVRFLNDLDADVRRADLEYVIALHERLGPEKDTFWKAVVGARDSQLNLIMYYLARRGRA